MTQIRTVREVDVLYLSLDPAPNVFPAAPDHADGGDEGRRS